MRQTAVPSPDDLDVMLASGSMVISAQAVAASVLDRYEIDIVDRALLAVAEQAPTDADILRRMIVELKQVRQLHDRQRQLREPTALGGEARDEHTLIRHLCTIDGLSGDLALPMKANLSRTYLLTKINFLRAFIKSTSALTNQNPECGRMCHELNEELAQSIYTLLAEELLLALLRKADVLERIKQRAADQLIAIWDDAALEIDDFAPLLESTWHARNRINSACGTMLGATETFRLVCEDCSAEVLDFFARDDMSADEAAAFDEFLFNMTHEELAMLRHEMIRQQVNSITPGWAARVLGRHIEELEHSDEIDPMALYRSYQRRQLAADFRIVAKGPGPRRTAEGYLMVYLLDQRS